MPKVRSTEGGLRRNASVGTDEKRAWASGLLFRGSRWKRIMRRGYRRHSDAGVRENVHHGCRDDERQETIVIRPHIHHQCRDDERQETVVVRPNVHHQCRDDGRQGAIFRKSLESFCDSAYVSRGVSGSSNDEPEIQIGRSQNDAEHIVHSKEVLSLLEEDSYMDESSTSKTCPPADLGNERPVAQETVPSQTYIGSDAAFGTLNKVSSINVYISKVYLSSLTNIYSGLACPL